MIKEDFFFLLNNIIEKIIIGRLIKFSNLNKNIFRYFDNKWKPEKIKKSKNFFLKFFFIKLSLDVNSEKSL